MAIYIAAFNLAVLFAPMDILMCFWDVVGASGPPALPGISNSCTYASLFDCSRRARFLALTRCSCRIAHLAAPSSEDLPILLWHECLPKPRRSGWHHPFQLRHRFCVLEFCISAAGPSSTLRYSVVLYGALRCLRSDTEAFVRSALRRFAPNHGLVQGCPGNPPADFVSTFTSNASARAVFVYSCLPPVHTPVHSI